MPIVLVVAAMPQLYRDATPNVVGQALEWFDPDAHDGGGDASFTDNPRRAKLFRNAEEALREWTRPSKVAPLRLDGKPNRPLTAFSVTTMSLARWKATLT